MHNVFVICICAKCIWHLRQIESQFSAIVDDVQKYEICKYDYSKLERVGYDNSTSLTEC